MIEISAIEAEALAGRRLDRRRKYAKTDDGSPCDLSGSFVFELCQFTAKCSGCSSDDPYESRGAGCFECGYHGVRRQAHWVPCVPELPL